MSIELPRTKWKVFFDNLSRDFSNWETSVQVMNGDIGAQRLYLAAKALSRVEFWISRTNPEQKH